MSKPKQEKPKLLAQPSIRPLARALKRLHFDPLRQLLNNVYPVLSPKEQANVCLFLAKEVYCTPRESKKRNQTIGTQQNIQVNVKEDGGKVVADKPKPSIAELLRLAEQTTKKKPDDE